MSCFLLLKLVDADMLGDDPIYNPVTLPLEQYLKVQNSKRMEGKKFLPKHIRQVVFDSWPRGTKVQRSCRLNNVKCSPFFDSLFVRILLSLRTVVLCPILGLSGSLSKDSKKKNT